MHLFDFINSFMLTTEEVFRKLFKQCSKTHGRNRAPKVIKEIEWIQWPIAPWTKTIGIANKDSIQLSCEFLRLFTTGNHDNEYGIHATFH